MIKRIRFATPPPGSAVVLPAWRRAVAAPLAAPAGCRPCRVVSCPVVSELSPDARHAAVAIEWFADVEHLATFERWLRSAPGAEVEAALADAVDLVASPVVVAEEHVLRGADWLEARWREGGEKVKHLALARRAPDLTPVAFAERWRHHAGSVGGATIPDAARGRAYVQDHPLPARADGSGYDAVNEVWFDDLDGVQARIDFFAANPPSADDLFGASWFLVVREELLTEPVR